MIVERKTLFYSKEGSALRVQATACISFSKLTSLNTRLRL